MAIRLLYLVMLLAASSMLTHAGSVYLQADARPDALLNYLRRSSRDSFQQVPSSWCVKCHSQKPSIPTPD
jgi:hypothetical protein